MNMAVIPARGGSKRIPRKNIRLFRGKPMIAWSIEAAVKCGLFEHVVVSTEDAEISRIAEEWGATAVCERPAALSDDHTGTTEVIAHAVDWASARGWNPSAVCCIYATAPFIEIADLGKALESLNSGDWHYVFAATTYAAPIFRSFRRAENGGVEMLFPEHFAARSQDLPETLHDAAQFYWGTAAAWSAREPIFHSHSLPLVLPRWRVQDIDDEDDWKRAEMIHKLLHEPTAWT